jgi:hypothetical protein
MTTPADPAGVAYVRRVLDAYRTTPGTTGHLRPADRRLACDLFLRGVPLQAVLDALLLATARRYGRATPGSLPPTVRSLAYFAAIVDEVASEPLADGYRHYLSAKLDRALPALGVIS